MGGVVKCMKKEIGLTMWNEFMWLRIESAEEVL